MPYDHNRVVLQNPIKGCNYINASWIKNEKSEAEFPTFIAAQGPLGHTIPHFLQMIIENKIKVIVMLTKLAEVDQGKVLWTFLGYMFSYARNLGLLKMKHFV